MNERLLEGKLICVSCNELIEDGYEWWTEDGPLCEGCVEYDEEHSSALLHFCADGTQIIHIGDYLCRDDEYGEDVSRDSLPIYPRAWVPTDAWRGYYDSKLKPGYLSLADGWATGHPDETVPRKVTILEFRAWLLKHGEEAPGEGLYILFEHTSNIFSQAVTIFCQEQDEGKIRDWLSRNSYPVELLYQALG